MANINFGLLDTQYPEKLANALVRSPEQQNANMLQVMQMQQLMDQREQAQYALGKSRREETGLLEFGNAIKALGPDPDPLAIAQVFMQHPDANMKLKGFELQKQAQDSDRYARANAPAPGPAFGGAAPAVSAPDVATPQRLQGCKTEHVQAVAEIETKRRAAELDDGVRRRKTRHCGGLYRLDPPHRSKRNRLGGSGGLVDGAHKRVRVNRVVAAMAMRVAAGALFLDVGQLATRCRFAIRAHHTTAAQRLKPKEPHETHDRSSVHQVSKPRTARLTSGERVTQGQLLRVIGKCLGNWNRLVLPEA